MNKILLFLLFSTSLCFAQMDYKLGVQGRTYPSLGASAVVDTGYNQLLWGSAGKDNVAYGLIRPYVRGEWSGVVNTSQAGIELFPISILGINVGKVYSQSDYDFPFFDCDEIDCDGYSNGDFTEYKLALGAFGIITMGRVRSTRFVNDTQAGTAKADWRNVIRMNPEYDTLYESEYILGYTSSKGMFGLMRRFAQYDISQDRSNLDAVVYINKTGSDTIVLGIGKMYTETNDDWKDEIDGTIVLFQWTRAFATSLKKF